MRSRAVAAATTLARREDPPLPKPDYAIYDADEYCREPDGWTARVMPFFEDDVPALGEAHLLAGSDSAHPEGLHEPADFAAEPGELPTAVRLKILRDDPTGLVA